MWEEVQHLKGEKPKAKGKRLGFAIDRANQRRLARRHDLTLLTSIQPHPTKV